MKRLLTAKSAGFCVGVAHSVALAEQALRKYGSVYCLGALVHNRDEVARLESMGLITVEDAESVPPGAAVLLRAHGAPQAVYETLRAKGATVIDATCGKVKRIHAIAADAARRGVHLVIFGDPAHPEVTGIRGWNRHAAVVRSPEELEKCLLALRAQGGAPPAIVFQSTETRANFKISENIKKKVYTNAEIFDTICLATQIRQAEASSLADICDAMIVVGGRHSANSRHLAEICTEKCGTVLFVENAAELDTSVLVAQDTVGITAGASVPSRIMKEVVQKMSDELNNAVESGVPAAEEETEKSFEELLEDSIKTIYNGDVVKGIVAAITPTEVTVDLGTKHSGYIPVEEFADENGTKIEDLIHVGDTVEASVVRVNDVEGTVMLSKRRLDAVKNWDDVEAACENETVVEGIVTEENKGGVVVKVKGLRVFVPASQSGLPRDAEMSQLLKKKVQLYITEVNKARRRVVGSIRLVAAKARREAIAKIWEEIEIGKRYHGVVKSLTSYGAFVDIGGVDGMVHVSELSWKRITKPSDVVSVGDEIEVYVINFDRETRKISLGYKDPNENPWEKFMSQYQVGDVAAVRVVKLMTFGAFAEIVPGVDGLIHISQIANRRIGKPDEVLHVDDIVDAKITAIDEDKHKVSLSIRALSEPAPASSRAQMREEPEEEEEPARVAEEDALVYEVSETGVSKGLVPDSDDN